MILWIDPGHVMARIGERGPIFPVTEDDIDIRPEFIAKFHAKLPSDELIRQLEFSFDQILKV
jgi:hypothetical protein